ncbi:MAG: hypothetical protein ACRET7_05940 [Burkholderiales bacterium]
MSRAIIRIITAAFLLFISSGGYAAEFVPYPGAVIDKAMSAKSTKVARDTGTNEEVSVYTTRDAFDRVAAFYAKLGADYPAAWTKLKRKLPDGREIRVKVFILDGKSDVADAKRWVQVQYPFIGDVQMEGTTPRYRDVRDQTAIIYILMNSSVRRFT